MARTKYRPLPLITESVLVRYWAKVLVGKPDECWPWLPSLLNHKHGVMGIGGRAGGTWLVHRVGYFIATGIDPLELEVCHSCDFPPCQNPAHLFRGTQADNVADMHKKGRGSKDRGENHSRVRLTWEQVQEIRRRYIFGTHKRGIRSSDLAKEFGISQHHLLGIVKEIAWKARN